MQDHFEESGEGLDPSQLLEKREFRGRLAWLNYTTPDFRSMTSIVFWNSWGFFFFGFIIPFATTQLFEASATDLGVVISAQTFGSLITTPIVSFVTDRVSKKKLVLFGSLGRATTYVVMYIGIVMRSIYVFGAGIFILGLTVGFFWTPLNTMISDKSYKTVRSSAFGYQMGQIGWGTFCGAIFTMMYFWVSLEFYPDNLALVYAPLLVFTLFNAFAGIRFNLRVDEGLTFDNYAIYQNSLNPLLYDKEIAEIYGDLAKMTRVSSKKILPFSGPLLGGFMVFLMAFFLAAINNSISWPYLQIFIQNEFTRDPIIIMLIYFPAQMLSQLFAPVIGRFADRINPVTGIMVVSSTGALLTWLLISSPGEIIFATILVIDSAFGYAGGVVIQNYLTRLSKSQRGKVIGVIQWVSMIGAVIGPLIGGRAAYYYGAERPFIISIFVELAIAPLYLIALRITEPLIDERVDRSKKDEPDLEIDLDQKL